MNYCPRLAGDHNVAVAAVEDIGFQEETGRSVGDHYHHHYLTSYHPVVDKKVHNYDWDAYYYEVAYALEGSRNTLYNRDLDDTPLNVAAVHVMMVNDVVDRKVAVVVDKAMLLVLPYYYYLY